MRPYISPKWNILQSYFIEITFQEYLLLTRDQFLSKVSKCTFLMYKYFYASSILRKILSRNASYFFT